MVIKRGLPGSILAATKTAHPLPPLPHSLLRDWVMIAKDKFILQISLVGSSSFQTFFIIVFMKRDFVESVL